MGDLIQLTFERQKPDPLKELRRKLRRKFDPERDVCPFIISSKQIINKFDTLSDDVFCAIALQDNDKINQIIKDNDPYDLNEIIESEYFQLSMSSLFENADNKKRFNKIYRNFKRRLHRKIKNTPEDAI